MDFIMCALRRFTLLISGFFDGIGLKLVLGLVLLVLLAACGAPADAPASAPAAAAPNLDVLDDEAFDIDVGRGSPLTVLQPPNTQDDIDVVVDWLFDTESPTPPESPAPESPKTSEILALAPPLAPKKALAPSPVPARFPQKNSEIQRAAVLLPLTGAYRQLGADLQKAINLAVISLNRPQFEVIFVDTGADADAAVRGAEEAVAAGADVFIGPLFSDQTAAIAPIAHAHDIPVLSFSNHSPNPLPNVWILGQQPEQELEAVLNYGLASLTAIDGIARQNIRVAVVVDDNSYGHNLRDFSLDYLQAAGVSRISRLLLDEAVLNDEAELRASIRQFAQWSAEEPTPIFDMVIICGDADFTLRVAPVLVWHDLDPASIRFIGSSQWSRVETINEPSLEGGLYAAVPSGRHARFQSIWQRYFNSPAHALLPLGFDAVAVASLLTADKTPEEVFLRPTGFAGFSGVFRLYADGSNRRQFEVRVIHDGQSTLVQSAPDSF